MSIPEPKRAVCSTCLRPRSTCICRWIAPVDNAVEVLILQHPLEAGEAKGSARILQLSLANSRLAVGETFPEVELEAMLHGSPENGTRLRQPVLLYPTDADHSGDDIPIPGAIPGAIPDDPATIRLVVLDGTWRKTRKTLRLNPLLHQLPRLPLTDLPPSHYLIRKAHRTDQLSTLEATCHALERLEHAAGRYKALLLAFDGFVAEQQARIPPEHRRQ